jgi:NADPH:quinone reductase-like Zn-dependent oxidoreductase
LTGARDVRDIGREIKFGSLSGAYQKEEAMKVIEIQGSFGIESLAVAERPEPEPGKGEVKIRMKASSLNFRDFLMVQGLYNPRQPLPIIPCSDGVGEVVEIGEGVSRVKVGDRVAGCFFQGWPSGEPTAEKAVTTLGSPLDGMLAEYRVLNEQGVVHVPEHLSDEQAATLPCAALTAWSALVTYGGRKAGDTILVQGTGGVSMFGLQIGKMIGARVVVTSSRNEKLDRAVRMGADHGINYKETPKWGKAAREWADGIGVDHVIEVGGAGTLQESLQAVRIGGEISMIGVLSGGAKELSILPILMKNVRVQGIFVGHREGFEAMNRAMAQHKLVPVVDRVFPFQEVKKALQVMERGEHFGKICLSF